MLVQVLIIVIPSLITFLTAFFLIRMMLKKDQETKRMELVVKNQQIITPIRLQAYERIILFLERISPNSLVMRVQVPNMSVKDLQIAMLANIRTEYEHNLSQQVYISSETWKCITVAKEHTVRLINTAADELKPNTNAIILSKTIFDKLIEMERAPHQIAIEKVKEEISRIF